MMFLSYGCASSKKERIDEELPDETIQQLDIPVDDFRKVIGWINEEEILIHTGNDSSEAISRFHIYTGELTPVFSEETFMLYIGFSPDKKRLLIQKAQDDQTELVVLSIDGDVIQERVIDTHGYVTADWNPEKPNLILLAYHYETENAEEIIVEKWDIEDNSAVVIEGSSLDIQWYSANLYVYVQVDGEDDQAGELYIGDLRSDESLKINTNIASFYLHEDTFITFAPSDFSSGDLLLTYEYPFMVEKGFLTIPSVTLSERLLHPHLSQGKRNSDIYAIIPKESVRLEETTGEFVLVKLNFEEQKVEKLMEVPDSAPISVAENENHFLYGWRYEYILDVKEQKLYPLFPEQG